MDKRERYTQINAQTWDAWAENGCEWTIPVTHDDILRARAGDWGVYLTPCRTVPREWFLPFENARILGLASGGGQQMPIFSVLGARCTLFDLSDSQLEKDRMIADREGYDIEIVKGDMTRPFPFEDGFFDLIFHPVSNCYIEDVYPVWRECARVLRPGGVLLAGLDNGLNFLFEDDRPLTVVNRLPFNPLLMPEAVFRRMAEKGEAIQFSHTLEEQIGGQLKAGFQLTDLLEDRDRPGGARIREYAPQYIATRAVKASR